MPDSDFFLKLSKKQKPKRAETSQENASVTPSPMSGTNQLAKRKKHTARKKTKLSNTYGRTASTNVRTDFLLRQIPSIPEKRRPERYAFQFWSDQVTRLKRLKQVLNLTGDPETREELSLSDMVRQAIDDYIDRQIKQLNKPVRAGE